MLKDVDVTEFYNRQLKKITCLLMLEYTITAQ